MFEFADLVTNSAGTITSAAATLVVNGVGTFSWGGLWRDVFVGISGSAVSNLTSAANYPSFPDASGVITSAEPVRGLQHPDHPQWHQPG